MLKHFIHDCSALVYDHDNYLWVQNLEFLQKCCYKLSHLGCCAVTLDKQFLTFWMHWYFATSGTTCPVTQHHIPIDFNFPLFVWYLTLTLYKLSLLNFKHFSFTSVTFHISFSIDFWHLPSTIIVIVGMVNDETDQWNLHRVVAL